MSRHPARTLGQLLWRRDVILPIWFCLWAAIMGVGAWLIDEPPSLIPWIAILGGLGAVGAAKLLL